MAGYIFAIGSRENPLDTIKRCAYRGTYSTCMKTLSPLVFEGTLADYTSMTPGDNIYFFSQRKIYGIGKLVNVGRDCKYCNFPGASKLEKYNYEDIAEELLHDDTHNNQSCHYRWLCTFIGDPFFFETGIDIDEVLSYKPHTFKMLRAFWKLTFIKLGDEENQSLKEIFLIRHQYDLIHKSNVLEENRDTHAFLEKKNLKRYEIKPNDTLGSCHDKQNRIKHEMAIEAAVIYDLGLARIPQLGKWDYISHQVIASPFKPIDYMDKIDVFAVRYLENTTIPCKYLVIEIKKDEAGIEVLDQTLKYVDWVCKEYAYGDYGLVESCIIAADYDDEIFKQYKNIVQRTFTLGSHPVRHEKWNAMHLMKYSYENMMLKYIEIIPT